MNKHKMLSTWGPFFVTVFVTIFPLLSTASPQMPCLNEAYPILRAPKCPSINGSDKFNFLSHIYPTAAIFLSLESDTEDSILTIITTLQTLANYIKINVIYTDEDFKRKFENRLNQSQLQNSIHFIQTNETYAFLRDPFLFGTDKSGYPVLIKPPANSYNFYPDLVSSVAKTCQFSTKDYSGLGQGGGAVEGGNFLMMPGNIMVTEGPKLFSELIHAARSGDTRAFGTAGGIELEQILKKQESDGNVYRQFISKLSDLVNIFETDLRSGGVFHIDENFSLVKIDHPGSCNFAIVVASPKEAVEIITKEKSTLISQSAIKANESIQKNLDGTLSDLLKAVAKETLCAHPAVIKLPTLYRDFYKGVVPSGMEHPNPINSLIVTPIHGASIAFVPSTGNDSFDKVIKNRLSQFGVRVESVATENLHKTGGDLHCASNQIQVCQP